MKKIDKSLDEVMAHVLADEDEDQNKTEEEDDEIDIVGIKTEEKHHCQDAVNMVSENVENDGKRNSHLFEVDGKNYENLKSSNNVQEPRKEGVEHSLRNNEIEVVPLKEVENFHNVEKDPSEIIPDSTSSVPSSPSSAPSSRVSSRRNSLNDSESVQSGHDECEFKVNVYEVDVNDDDDIDHDSNDPYQRFFFESDHLALKDNKDYNLLLQTLVALEGQRMQAIRDLDTLCVEEAKALDDPIGFVEKLQNNEPLNLPPAQNVVKLPKIPWESYASSFGPLDMSSLSIQYNTRASVSTLSHEKVEPEPQVAANLFNRELVETNSSDSIFSETQKNTILGKLPTYNQPWTIAEQTRLEKLLQVFPQEEIEAKRWEKIAKALGNRTPKQVASRIQKYFIKLAKAGLPIPGRVPNIPRSGARTAKRSTHYQTMGFRNSTFFPSYQPRVLMNDKDDDVASLALSDDTDDESIPEELRQSREYMELLELKKIKKQKLKHGEQGSSSSHVGFMCDGCGIDPIVGTRWHCRDCPLETSLDFCSQCIDRGVPESRGHSRQHRFEPITKAMSFYVDGDYVGNTGPTGSGYNYLDPNFLPASS